MITNISRNTILYTLYYTNNMKMYSKHFRQKQFQVRDCCPYNNHSTQQKFGSIHQRQRTRESNQK